MKVGGDVEEAQELARGTVTSLKQNSLEGVRGSKEKGTWEGAVKGEEGN